MTSVGIIFAQGSNGAFGHNGALPWSIPEDLRFFKSVTRHHAVIMGRRTWESLPASQRPLKERINIIVTRQREQSNYAEGVYYVRNLRTAIEVANALQCRRAWVIGGPGLIREAEARAEMALITSVDYSGPFDVQSPLLTNKDWICTSVLAPKCPVSQQPMPYRFSLWRSASLVQGGLPYE